jgi:four helix bundle protein
MAFRGYHDLKVWHASVSLVERIYHLTNSFPREEVFTLTQQLRRASISIPSNIAEGHSRNSTRDFLRYLYIAGGSLAELHTQLLIANRLQYSGISETDALLREIDKLGRMLRGLQQSLHRRIGRASRRNP